MVAHDSSAWRARGEALVAELRSERDALMRKVEEIDSTLRMMGRAPTKYASQPRRAPRTTARDVALERRTTSATPTEKT